MRKSRNLKKFITYEAWSEAYSKERRQMRAQEEKVKLDLKQSQGLKRDACRKSLIDWLKRTSRNKLFAPGEKVELLQPMVVELSYPSKKHEVTFLSCIHNFIST
jgi:hypothetical protein